MQENPRHISPLADQLPKDTEEASRPINALVRLVELFYSSSSAKITPQQQSEATRRFYGALTVYSELSGEVAGLGISEEHKKRSIINVLKDEGLISATDSSRADKEYIIISEGYDLNKERWDKELGINDRNV